jgi:hypothetical protein
MEDGVSAEGGQQQAAVGSEFVKPGSKDSRYAYMLLVASCLIQHVGHGSLGSSDRTLSMIRGGGESMRSAMSQHRAGTTGVNNKSK